jgi:hypothetical protein
MIKLINKKTTYSIKDMNFPLEKFTFLGLISMIDPPKAGVA